MQSWCNAWTNDTLTFGEFKTNLQSYESTEKHGKSDVNTEQDNVMKTTALTRTRGRGSERKMALADIECYSCGQEGHMARTCPIESQMRKEEQK